MHWRVGFPVERGAPPDLAARATAFFSGITMAPSQPKGRHCIQVRISSTRQAVTRSDSLTGEGNSPAFTLRQSVADENGTMVGISWDWRT
jgi:hypothetical protein